MGINLPRPIILLIATPLSELWRYYFWSKVNMGHMAHRQVGFEYEPYCTKQFGEKNWTRYDTTFYFRHKADATLFALRWL